jgi:hypothetical protein
MAVQTHPQLAARPDTLLRRALQADAVFTAVSAIGAIAASSVLAGWLAVPAPALIALGALLLAWAVFLWTTAARPAISRRAAWVAVVAGALTVIDLVTLLATGWLPFSAEGWWLMAIMALLVAGFTEAQYIGLRRLGRG